MNRQSVQSSNLVSVGYDAKSQILEIAFNNDRMYQYSGVDAETHERLMESQSKGRFFFSQIRGKYDETEVTPPKQDTMDTH